MPKPRDHWRGEPKLIFLHFFLLPKANDKIWKQFCGNHTSFLIVLWKSSQNNWIRFAFVTPLQGCNSTVCVSRCCRIQNGLLFRTPKVQTWSKMYQENTSFCKACWQASVCLHALLQNRLCQTVYGFRSAKGVNIMESLCNLASGEVCLDTDHRTTNWICTCLSLLVLKILLPLYRCCCW